MSEKNEALRLADALTAQPVCICHATCYIECACDAIWPEQWVDIAAAKLRRFSAENETLKAQRDALLAALEEIHQATMKNKVVIAKYVGINFLAAIAIRKAKEGK